MSCYDYNSCKNQLEIKLQNTLKENEKKDLLDEEKEGKIYDKFSYFCNKIINIILSSTNLFEEYKKSNFNDIKSSDNIIRTMKQYIRNSEPNDLLALVEKKNDFKFDEEIEEVIESETRKNIDSFIEKSRNSQKAKIFGKIGEIKTKFEAVFFSQEFHMNILEKKINEKIADFTFKEEEMNEINDIIKLIMIQKFKELINKELEFNN